MFSLVVDDFGVRYTKQADADHLVQTLEANAYQLKVRPLGDKYLGMSITFDRERKTVSLSMPGYVTKILQRFRPQYLLPGHRPAKNPGRYIAPSSYTRYQRASGRIHRQNRKPKLHTYHGTAGHHRHIIILR